MKIQLNKKQLGYLYNLAQLRHNAKHESFRNASKIIPKHKEDDFVNLMKLDKEYMPHFLGLVGEFVWSQHSGEELDEEIYSVRDGGEDFNGVEVKTITYMGDGEPELKITQKEYEARKKPKKYVLARFDMSTGTVEILGTITRYMFDKHKISKKYGRFLPNNYVVPLSKMRKI